MALSFGGQTITFKHYTESGTPDELGGSTMTTTTVDAPRCRHRPLTYQEMIDAQFDIATEMWRSTIPVGGYDGSLRSSVLAATANDAITVGGVDYQIVGGVRHHVDMAGNPYKVTIISTKQIG